MGGRPTRHQNQTWNSPACPEVYDAVGRSAELGLEYGDEPKGVFDLVTYRHTSEEPELERTLESRNKPWIHPAPQFLQPISIIGNERFGSLSVWHLQPAQQSPSC